MCKSLVYHWACPGEWISQHASQSAWAIHVYKNEECIYFIYTTYILHNCVIKSTVTWIYFVHTVYRAIFALYNFRPSRTSLTVSPRLELVQTHLCLKRENMSYWNLPSPKFACWQRGWKDKNKRRKYFPVYSIYIIYTEWAWSRSIFPYTCNYSFTML